MKRLSPLDLLPALLAPALLAAAAALPGPARAEDWPQFRGPGAAEVSAEKGLPEEWGAEKNLLWKVEVPGEGWSSPIVWGERVLLTTAVGAVEEKKEPPKNSLDEMFLASPAVSGGRLFLRGRDHLYCIGG